MLPMLLPDYACAIISVDSQAYLFEQRDDKALHAANQLTCFGGRRHSNESALECVRRELDEELHWQAKTVSQACSLWVGQRYVADFFHCVLDIALDDLRYESGRCGIVLQRQDIEWSQQSDDLKIKSPPISPWHRAALAAYWNKQNIVRLA